jgi:YbgC/YbaW family acyl-CoA thioester hydrolase
MKKIFKSTALIRFADCDPFRHLNNSRYLDYFLNAREDHLRNHHGFDIYEYSTDSGHGWVVREHRIAYMRPAKLMETIVLKSGILTWGSKHIHVEMTMWNEAQTELKALLWSQFVHVNLQTGKSAIQGEEIKKRFSVFEIGLPEAGTFEQRLAEYQLGVIP